MLQRIFSFRTSSFCRYMVNKAKYAVKLSRTIRKKEIFMIENLIFKPKNKTILKNSWWIRSLVGGLKKQRYLCVTSTYQIGYGLRNPYVLYIIRNGNYYVRFNTSTHYEKYLFVLTMQRVFGRYRQYSMSKQLHKTGPHFIRYSLQVLMRDNADVINRHRTLVTLFPFVLKRNLFQKFC